jgi:nitroreductase
MRELLEVIRQRQSCRVPFDSHRPVPERDLRQILEAARWAPTAHNMQNFDVIVVDDPKVLQRIGAIPARPSTAFLRENYQQLSFSEEELLRRRTGVLASMFPPSWRTPEPTAAADDDPEHASLAGAMRGCPTLLLIVHDIRQRAPDSEGDLLGMMSLGCVMQNLWLMTELLGIGIQVLSVFASPEVRVALHPILEIPAHQRIAYACRLGYPQQPISRYLRVRRDCHAFTHRNRYGLLEHL